MFGLNFVKFTSFLLLIQLLLLPVLSIPNPESFVPMNLNTGEFGSDVMIQPMEFVLLIPF